MENLMGSVAKIFEMICLAGFCVLHVSSIKVCDKMSLRAHKRDTVEINAGNDDLQTFSLGNFFKAADTKPAMFML
jgi:hypothetical protein